MTVKIPAHFANGVFVPDFPVELPEQQRVTLTIDTASDPSNTTSDPMPSGGAALLDWWSRHRIQLDPEVAKKIIHSKAYEYNEEPDDEP